MTREDDVVMEERLRATYAAVTSRTNYSPPPPMPQGDAVPHATSTSRRPRRVRRFRRWSLATRVPAFSVAKADELVVRRRITRRAPVFAALAACLAIALVVGGSLVLSGSDDSPSVQTPRHPISRQQV